MRGTLAKGAARVLAFAAMRLWTGALLCAIWLPACASRTEVVVGLATDLTTPRDIDVVDLVVLDRVHGRQVQHRWQLAKGQNLSKLPASFGLVPMGDATQEFEVRLSGSRILSDDGKGNLKLERHVERRARLSFVQGKTLFLRMALMNSCYDRLEGACPADQWCVEGRCAPIAVSGSSLPPYVPGAESNAACGSAAASLGLGGAAGACPDGETCVEASCIASAPPTTSLMDLAGAEDVDGGSDDLPGDDGAAPDATALPDSGAIMSDMMPAADAGSLDQTGGAPDQSIADLAVPDLSATASPDLARAAADLAVAPQVDLAVGPTGTGALSFQWISPAPSNDPITGVALDESGASGRHVWAVNDHGAAISWSAKDGYAVEDVGVGGVALRGVAVHGGDVWAVGDGAFVAHHAANGAWTVLPVDPVNRVASFTTVAVEPNTGVAVAAGTRTDKSVIVARATPTNVSVVDIVAFGYGPVAALNVDGTCAMLVGAGNLIRVNSGFPTTKAWSDPHWLPRTGKIQTADYGALSGCGATGTTIVGSTVGVPYYVSLTLDASKLLASTGSSLDGPITNLATTSAPHAATLDTWGVDTLDQELFRFNGTSWTVAQLPQVPTGDQLTWLAAAPVTGGDELVIAAGGGLWSLPPAATQLTRIGPTGVRAPHGTVTVGASLSWDGPPWGTVDSSGNTKTLLVPASYNAVANNGQSPLTITLDGGATWKTLEKSTPAGLQYCTATGGVVDSQGVQYFAGCDMQLLTIDDKGLAADKPFTSLFTVASMYPSIESIWAADRANVYVAAITNDGTVSDGLIYSSRGGSWAVDLDVGTLLSPGSMNVVSIWGFAKDDVWAVGYANDGPSVLQGYVLHRDASGWHVAVPPKAGGLPTPYTIWGAAPGDLWIGCANGALVHLTVDANTQAITTRAFLTPTRDDFAVIRGTSPSDIYAGDGGGGISHFDGSSWRLLDSHTNVINYDYVSGIWVDAHDVWVGGNDHVLWSAR